MAVFTDAELEYLDGQHLGRLATASPKGEPEVSPVGFSADADGIVTGGLDISKTLRYRNIQRTGRASMVVTSNRDTAEWLAMFDDMLLAQSAVDRFKNSAYDFVIEGESYRPRLKPKLDTASPPPPPVNKPKVHPRSRARLRR
jgi:PPOX class F420-dependent enzyme/OxyR family protein